jgi:serine/threonine protein kinase
MTAEQPGTEGLLDERYRLGERLGGGAVADVYRAVDERLSRPVAVKVFRGDAAEQLQRHEAEMRTLARLDHPSLVTVFDAGTDHDRPYLVMQLVEGTTLAEILRDGPVPAQRVAAYGAALADALAYVHGQGFVHRDVKPANVLVGRDDRVMLADFGIARLVDSAHVTATGDVLGTPAYFAPEQVAGEAVGSPADVYALGLVLLECLTGERAYTGTAMEVAMARLHRDPEVPESLPLPWRSLLEWMTTRQPSDRPSAAEVAASLRQIAAGLPSDASTVAIRRPAPRPREETMVMPATQAMTQSVEPAATPAGTGRRFSPAVVALVVLVAAAIGIAVAFAVNRNASTGDNTVFKPGKPTLQQPYETDVQRLERLVRP